MHESGFCSHKQLRLQVNICVYPNFAHQMPQKTLIISFTLTSIIALMSFQNIGEKYSVSENCLFKNPLCFFNTDILTYQQILFKNMQFEKMVPFFYGPWIKSQPKNQIISHFSKAQFGYSLKRIGIRTNSVNSWSIMYQKTIMGTNHSFSVQCALINDTCRIWLDQEAYNSIFTH